MEIEKEKTAGKSLNNTVVVLMAVLGFVFTAVLLFPHKIFYDFIAMFSSINANGVAVCDNWFGWYMPKLWEYLYKVTGFDYVIGTYVHFVYWFAVTWLYFAMSSKIKINPLFYVPFAFFPPALLFIGMVSNNALLFVTLLLGLAMYFHYRNAKRVYWLILSLFFIVQCVFIRREALFFIFFLLLLVLYVEFSNGRTRLKASFLSFFVTLGIVFLPLAVEHVIVKNVPGYHVINSVSYTGVWDLSCMSIYKGECLIPAYCRNSMLTDKECLDVLKTAPESALLHDYDFPPVWEKIGYKRFPSNLKTTDYVKICLKNWKYYLKHKAKFIFHFVTASFVPFGHRALYTIGNYTSRNVSQVSLKLEGLWLLFGFDKVIYVFYVLAVYLALSWKKLIIYDDLNEKKVMLALCLCSIVGCCVIFFGAPTVQVRYIATYLCIMYFVSYAGFVKTLYKLRLTENNGDADGVAKQD